jgi:type I restriction enzyme R subunit
VSKDLVLEAGYSAAAQEKARSIVESFETFIRENKDEITALQVLYSRPYKQRLTFKQIKELADAIQRPPRAWTPELLWQAYEKLDRSKVRGSGGRLLTDIVSLVRFALHQGGELRPFQEQVHERFSAWLAQQETSGRKFTDEQRQWLGLIRDHIASSLAIERDDFEYVPFAQHGGLGKAYQVFGQHLTPLLNELNEVLVA